MKDRPPLCEAPARATHAGPDWGIIGFALNPPNAPPPPAAPATPVVSASAWAPLSQPVFRMLWVTWLVANTCMWMNDVAAAWLMTTLTTSPALVALVQTASMLPVFLLGLPSGALADILDRRLFFMVTQFWVAGVAVVTCLLVLGGGMTPALLLALTFANGIGLAMRWPVFAAIVPELVPRLQLPAALALNGIAMNGSRIIGPLLAGAIIASLGSAYVFVLNALLSVAAGFVIFKWKRERTVSALPGERFVGAIRVGWQYVRQSTRMHAVLVRIALFFLQSTAVLALLPLVARGLDDGGAGTFTLLLAAMGSGAVVAAAQLPRLRARFNRDQLVNRGSVVQAAATVILAFAPNVWVAVPAMFISGMAWITVANTLTVAAQLALPDWVRARGMSIYQMALMGSAGASAALWGQVASWTSVPISLIAAAVIGQALLVWARRMLIEGGAEEDLTPSQAWKPPVTATPIDPDAGPVLVTIEYQIDPARAEAFRAVMQESRRSRLRHGALAWELFRDVNDPGRYTEYFIDESWVEHLRRFDRVTAADVHLRERRLAFHLGDQPPRVTRRIAETLEPH
ncbi:arabinose ABC transporter permease [Caldimonas caldifontis]|uniref:Arabinose ABC transporter permease n=1 Tax=Caldimonas caldifontis TaxID=1452508 RepID=A0A2S5SSY8_9BURK|nr:arabinose ABC transporter permease [Caldimonas caldifontis]